MDALGVAADERMPAWQRFAAGDDAVAAGVGKPGHFVDVFGRDFDAVGDVFLAVGVIGAAVSVQA